MEAIVVAGLDLVAHINLASLVFSYQDHGQAGPVAAFGQAGGTLGGFSAELLGKGVAVDELGWHGGGRWRAGGGQSGIIKVDATRGAGE
ncbi:hypothetical protein CS8_083790 [Cupriavidus sp. 8B]